MPKVYYFNLDSDTERKCFMESQFHKYGINYERVSQSCYVKDNFYEWVYRFEDSDFIRQIISPTDGYMYPANFLRHLDFMNEWLISTDEDYLLIMEDDYDLSLIEYWHFDWKYFIRHLPADWEAVKLNNDSKIAISFYVHPLKPYDNAFGTMLFQRSFVEKIVRMYFGANDKIKSYEKRSLNIHLRDIDKYNVDFTLGSLNSLYVAPMITTEASLCIDDGGGSSRDVFEPIQRACHHWWKNERDLFTLDDFFTHGKPYDDDMTIYLGDQIR